MALVPCGVRWTLTLSILAAAACGGPKHSASARPHVTAGQNVTEPPRVGGSPASHGEAARWDPDDHEWIMSMLKELRRTGEADGRPRLVELADRVTVLVQQVDDGQLTKEQLLEAFHTAEQQMTDPIEDKVEEMLDDLRGAMRHVKRVLRDP